MSGQINRAAQLWRSWEEKEKMLLKLFGQGQLSENLNKQKYQFLSSGLDRIAKDISPDEKLVSGLIKKSTLRLQKELYPHPLLRLMHRIKLLVYDRPLAASKLKKLQAENMVALTSAFGKIGLNTKKINLQQHLNTESQKLDIPLLSPLGTSNYIVKVHLERDLFGKYEMPSYTARLKDSINPENSKSYTFYTHQGINAREAANLLQGRPVLLHHKTDGDKMSSKWVQLDFSKLSNNGQPLLRETGADYEYNLRQQVVTIAEMLDKPELASVRVLDGMEQGNQIVLKQVTGERLYLEADPLGKSITIRNAAGQKTAMDKVLQKRKNDLELKPEKKLTRNRTKQQTQSQSLGLT